MPDSDSNGVQKERTVFTTVQDAVIELMDALHIQCDITATVYVDQFYIHYYPGDDNFFIRVYDLEKDELQLAFPLRNDVTAEQLTGILNYIVQFHTGGQQSSTASILAVDETNHTEGPDFYANL